MRRRIEAAFDRFIDVRNMADKDVALLARKLEVDIAIDLGGFTEGSRTDIFALRAAPLQVSYLGYPGTMGAEYMDYLIADRTLIPEGSRRHYAEKIAYLPDSYLVNDGKRAIAERNTLARRAGFAAHRLCVLRLQQELQDHPRHLRHLDAHPPASRGQRAVAAGRQSHGHPQSAPGSQGEGGGRRAAGICAANAAGRAPGTPSRRRSVPRRAALQRPHHGVRRAVGGVAGAHLPGREPLPGASLRACSLPSSCPSSSPRARSSTRRWPSSWRPLRRGSSRSSASWSATG